MVEAKERRAELHMAQQFDDDKARRKYYSSNYTTDGVYSHLYPLLSCQFVADRSVILLKLYFEHLWRFPKVRCVRVQGRCVVRFSEKRLQRQENGLDAIDSGPLVLKNVKANCTGCNVDIGVETW